MRTALPRFLLDLLAGTNSLDERFGKIERLQWQGQDLGWLADDLVIECLASADKLLCAFLP